jgi:hypothetical protein
MINLSSADANPEVTIADLLKMLRFALIEIRASEEVQNANRLADIFHQVPSFAAGKSADQSAQVLYERMLAKADTYGMSSYIKKLTDAAQCG